LPGKQNVKWNRSRSALAVAGTSLLLAAIYFIDYRRADKTGERSDEASASTAATISTATSPSANGQASQSSPLSLEDSEFIASLREKFGGAIRGKHPQVKAIEQLIAYLMAHYPDDWRSRVADFLRQLFPELADELYARFESLMKYDDWLREHRAELQKMSPTERRQALWEARHATFGADADEIWAAELRNERIGDSLAALQAAGAGMTLERKLAAYLGAVNQAYGADARHFIEHRQTEFMNRFLGVETVQDDLRQMSAAERQAALRQVRSALGMDAAALQRWDELDRQRDQAWDAGRQYMSERGRILANSKETRARDLQDLQDRMFGPEAETLRSEEAAGFFRYSHQRRIGRE
jgi:hypothetical protein